jgi:hypothetical protein
MVWRFTLSFRATSESGAARAARLSADVAISATRVAVGRPSRAPIATIRSLPSRPPNSKKVEYEVTQGQKGPQAAGVKPAP